MSSRPSMTLLVTHSEPLGCNVILINDPCDPDEVIELAREVGAIHYNDADLPEFLVDFGYLGRDPQPEFFGEEALREQLYNDLAAAKTIGV